MIQKAAELISNGMTVSTIILSSVVIYLWRKSAQDLFVSRKKFTSDNWFIVGVFLGFVAQFFDNLYWLLPWTAKYLGLEEADSLVEFGVFINIPIRQTLGSIAAYCHIRAALQYHDHASNDANKILFCAASIGLAYSVALILASYL